MDKPIRRSAIVRDKETKDLPDTDDTFDDSPQKISMKGGSSSTQTTQSTPVVRSAKKIVTFRKTTSPEDENDVVEILPSLPQDKDTSVDSDTPNLTRQGTTDFNYPSQADAKEIWAHVTGDSDSSLVMTPPKTPSRRSTAVCVGAMKTTSRTFRGMNEALNVPEGETLPYWIFLHTRHFVNVIKMHLQENIHLKTVCTPTTCPAMTVVYTEASTRNKHLLTFFWPGSDGKNYNVPAKVYIYNLVGWINELLDNPKTFKAETLEKNTTLIRAIYRRTFRVFAHVWTLHLKDVVEDADRDFLDTELKRQFKLFIVFVLKYNLVAGSDLDPLLPDIQAMRRDSPTSKVARLKAQ